jgi:pyridoxine 4-dehydrogenase
LTEACLALADATAEGLCGSWGIASWNPAAVAAAAGGGVPVPEIVMVRAGLLVCAAALDEAQALAEVFGVPCDRLRGMSPFGGDSADPVWRALDPRIFLSEHRECSRAQAALRVAYYLPEVHMIAVGTDDPAHLRELADAMDLAVDLPKIGRYRDLLRRRANSQAASAPSSPISRAASRSAGASSGSSSAA